MPRIYHSYGIPFRLESALDLSACLHMVLTLKCLGKLELSEETLKQQNLSEYTVFEVENYSKCSKQVSKLSKRCKQV